MVGKITIIHKKDGEYSIAPADTLKLKNLYNYLLSRIRKAEKYFDDVTIAEEEKELFIPEFKKLLKQISAVMNLMDLLQIPFRKEHIA